jgi:hypothetical protein
MLESRQTLEDRGAQLWRDLERMDLKSSSFSKITNQLVSLILRKIAPPIGLVVWAHVFCFRKIFHNLVARDKSCVLARIYFMTK